MTLMCVSAPEEGSHVVSNGCSSPTQQQLSPDRPPPPSTPESPEILRELRRYAASADEDAAGVPSDLPSPLDMSSTPASDSQHNQSDHIRHHLAAAAADIRGTKRKLSTNNSNGGGSKQFGSKRASAAGRFPGMSPSSGVTYPSGSLSSSSSLMGNMGHMTHPYLMGGSSGGSAYLQTAGQTLGDLQAMFPSAASDLLCQGSAHLPSAAPSCSSLSSGYAATGPTMSSAPSASTSSSSSLPPYMMNPSMAGLLAPGYSLNYSQSEPRMYSNPLGGFPSPGLSSFSSPHSSLLGMALSQADAPFIRETDNGGTSSDDDVIEVMGQ